VRRPHGAGRQRPWQARGRAGRGAGGVGSARAAAPDRTGRGLIRVTLRRIELIGFKSFASRTVFDFDVGLAAVVGPNGSGKSNIADAVRWVLGEQKPRLLRGKRAEDVIFAGSAS